METDLLKRLNIRYDLIVFFSELFAEPKIINDFFSVFKLKNNKPIYFLQDSCNYLSIESTLLYYARLAKHLQVA